MGSHAASILVASALLCGVLCSAQNSNCQCYKVGDPAQPTAKCSDGLSLRPIGPRNNYQDHFHPNRRLYGDCLPEVEENSMKCFKWRTKSCLDGTEFCELIEQDTTDLNQGQVTYLTSPGFNKFLNKNRKRFSNRLFCIYRVSLDCSGDQGSVDIQSTVRTNWTMDPQGCRDYVAFYTNNSSSRQPDHQFCSGDSKNVYRKRLDSTSFVAVLWTDKDDNEGIFEFQAKCSEQEQEGSGLAIQNY